LTIWQAASATFAFNKVTQQHYSDEMGKFIFSAMKFNRDILHQKLLKSIKFLSSNSKNTGAGLF